MRSGLLFDIRRDSYVDGPGIRFVVFCQGCPHNCEGCHNPATHEFGAGRETSVERILAEFDKDPLLDGITLSGGEPFCQPKAMAAIVAELRRRHPEWKVRTSHGNSRVNDYRCYQWITVRVAENDASLSMPLTVTSWVALSIWTK